MQNSQAFKEAQQVIPGGVDSPVRAFSSVGGEPIFIDYAKGSYMYDIEGKKYLDFVQSWGPLVHGHCDEDIEKSVNKAVSKGLSFGAPTLNETSLATKIINLFPHLDKLRFVSSGTEAVMSAIRLARGVTKRDDIIKFEGCYHGHSDSLLVEAGSGAITFGNPSSPGVPKDFTKHTLLAKYNDIQSVKKCFENSKDIACVIIEPIAGNMGLVPADLTFLQELKNLCQENGTLLIFDEVMSGFRASLKGSYGINNIEADIVTFGKVIGGGMPVGAFAANTFIMDHLSPDGAVYQAGTLSGNPIAMAAGEASLDKLATVNFKKLEQLANYLVSGLRVIASMNNITLQTTVRGSMFGFFFNDNIVKNFDDAKTSNSDMFAKFHTQMIKRGVYFACSQYETGFISTVTTKEQIDDVLQKASEVFACLN